jgi:hypothetical protein
MIYLNETLVRDKLFDIVGEVVSGYLDESLTEDLLKFQKSCSTEFSKIGDSQQSPPTQSFDHDFWGYLLEDSQLRRPTTYRFEYRSNVAPEINHFCEAIYYLRRNQLTKMRIIKK